jgi:hypothetical protein
MIAERLYRQRSATSSRDNACPEHGRPLIDRRRNRSQVHLFKGTALFYAATKHRSLAWKAGGSGSGFHE